MATPFLFELRALMDWIWTETSMPLFEWLKMEDIFANIYELKVFFELIKPIVNIKNAKMWLITRKHPIPIAGFSLICYLI